LFMTFCKKEINICIKPEVIRCLMFLKMVSSVHPVRNRKLLRRFLRLYSQKRFRKLSVKAVYHKMFIALDYMDVDYDSFCIFLTG